jgi:hypothetical protein
MPERLQRSTRETMRCMVKQGSARINVAQNASCRKFNMPTIALSWPDMSLC